MGVNRANKSYIRFVTRWMDRLFPFEFTINNVTDLKMGLIDYITSQPQHEAAKISTYEEKLIVETLDAIKRSAKRFLLSIQNYTYFAN